MGRYMNKVEKGIENKKNSYFGKNKNFSNKRSRGIPSQGPFPK